MAEHIAKELGQKIHDVETEKRRLDAARRQTEAYVHNQKAQRLVRRLEECDGNIASLLSQAADCLDTLLEVAAATSPSATSSSNAARAIEVDADGQALSKYEAKAQDWFATLHDVQLGLRSAVRNLQKTHHAPLTPEVALGSGANAGLGSANIGSAARGHSLSALSLPSTSAGDLLAPNSRRIHRKNSNASIKTIGPGSGASTSMTTDWRVGRTPQRRSFDGPVSSNGGRASMDGDDHSTHNGGSLLSAFVDLGGAGDKSVLHISPNEFAQESKLSLSSLRQQERSWRELAGALSTVAAQQAHGDGEGQQLQYGGGGIAQSLEDEQNEQDRALMMQSTDSDTDKGHAQGTAMSVTSTADTRLLSAILHLRMEILPETSVTPVTAPPPAKVV